MGLTVSLLAACGGDTDTAGELPSDAGQDTMQADAGSTMDGGMVDAGGSAAVSGARLPLLTPPVRAATPPGLGGTAAPVARSLRLPQGIGRQLQALDSVDFKSRFFTAGPTSIFQIIGMLDMRIAEINARSQNNDSSCLTQAPVAYTLKPFGQTLTFFAQCQQTFSVPSAAEQSFFQFGRQDGVTYLYIASGVQHVAARITPVIEADAGTATGDAGAAGTRYRTDIWIGIGYNNATACGNKTGFDGCSYGAIELHTDETKSNLELTVAGLGFGYCGAQLKSDGISVFGRGSLDMGETCLDPTDLCVAASDVSTPATCSGSLSTFTAAALGRRMTVGTAQSFGASKYPGEPDNQIVLTGMSTDSLRFGPSAPTPGVGEFSSGSGGGGGTMMP